MPISTKLCISSTTASHNTITYNYFSNTVLDIQDTQRSAIMQEEALKFHKQNREKGLHKVKLKVSPQNLHIWKKETDN